MPDPAKLPYELFTIILDLAFEDSNRDSTLQHLCALSLFSRQWNKVLLPRIYSKWTYNGARQPFMTLWKFFITIRRDPYLAGLIKTLTIGSWGFYPPRYPKQFRSQFSQLYLPPDELVLARMAIHDAGIGNLEDDIVRSLSERDRRPVMALLLTVSAHVPHRDQVLKAVLEKAVSWEDGVNYSPGLACLKELNFVENLGSDSIDSDSDDNEDTDTDSDYDEAYLNDDINTLDVDYLLAIFHLPSLRTLSLSRLNCTGAATSILGNSTGIYQLEGLSITSSAFEGQAWPHSDLWTLITQPRALKFLAFYLKQNTNTTWRAINTDLWNSLQEQKTSLGNLDLHITHHRGYPPPLDIAPFGPLSEFTCPKYISIHADMLLGRHGHESTAPFRLRDALPTSLRSLTFYQTYDVGYADDLPEQLMEVILSGDFPLLRTITLEQIFDHSAWEDSDSDYYLERKYKAVDHASLERDIDFYIVETDEGAGFSLCRDIFNKTEYLQRDGCARNLTLARYLRSFKDLQELVINNGI
ncbi:hypothetical protein PHISCL_06159 [Aspergillus sclerotialis]|uniref:F-box domain-containing protein n=1 Tax=Aspergillus sclerotialis TaxID=2070753 RepID=A0A3A2ZJB8_9EURO|nr:hypothetical protein PHISCL_06159 [Aspergillus sclerotialis]